jgi:flagellar secretion chaperone FliS
MNAKSAYRESALRGATSVGLVVMLYEQAVQDLQRALEAIKENNIELRTREIDHALRVLGQLQGTLDKERGCEIARNLERFYALAQASLLNAQVKVAPEILRKRIGDLLELREAWIEVDQQLSRPAAAEHFKPTKAVEMDQMGEVQTSTRGSWRG